MTRYSPQTNKAQFESESYGQGEELNELQNSAEMFIEENQTPAQPAEKGVGERRWHAAPTGD